MGRVDADTMRVAAGHHVVFRLLLRGHDASLTSSDRADILVCSADGLRVALLSVRALDDGGSLRVEEQVTIARNRAYICVEIPSDEQQPSCYVVPSVVFAKVVLWTRGSLEPFRDAWHLLGLDGASLRIAS